MCAELSLLSRQPPLKTRDAERASAVESQPSPPATHDDIVLDTARWSLLTALRGNVDYTILQFWATSNWKYRKYDFQNILSDVFLCILRRSKPASVVAQQASERCGRSPEHEHAEHSVGGTAHGRRLVVVVASGARLQHDCSDERRRAPYEVHRTAAGDVDHAQLVEPAGAAEHPVRREAVDECVDDGEDDVSFELHALRHPACKTTAAVMVWPSLLAAILSPSTKRPRLNIQIGREQVGRTIHLYAGVEGRVKEIAFAIRNRHSITTKHREAWQREVWRL